MAATTNAPAPDDPRKPESPPDLAKPSWAYVARSSVREFFDDDLIDLSAALTYFSVLSIFPAVLTLVSIFNLFGQDPRNIQVVLGELEGIIPADSMAVVADVVEGLLVPRGAGIGLLAGTLIAFWTASLYVRGFGRAMNRIYDVPEGRPLWKVWGQMYLLTVVILVLVAIVVVGAVLSGPVAETVGEFIGLGRTAVAMWDLAKWPVLLLVVAVILALLYYYTPNVKQPRLRWISVGAVVALLIAAVASLGFGVYVANFGNYHATYGALAGVIIFLFWLWIMNLAILFGAEIDAELERARQLQGGIAAERQLKLPPRDTTASDKQQAKKKEHIERGRALRLSAAGADDSEAGDPEAGDPESVDPTPPETSTGSTAVDSPRR